MLAQARLVSTEAESVEVAHESLATAWPRLTAWLEEDAESARILTMVSAAAEAWNAAGRPEDDLYRGARLQAALEWRDEAPRDLTDVEAAFLDASAARATAEQEQLAERARRDRRQNRRLRVPARRRRRTHRAARRRGVGRGGVLAGGERTAGQRHDRGARRAPRSRCGPRSATSPRSSPPRRIDDGPMIRGRGRD